MWRIQLARAKTPQHNDCEQTPVCQGKELLLSLAAKKLGSVWIDYSQPGARSCLSTVSTELDTLHTYLTTNPISETSIPGDIISYIFDNKGKRMRPAIFFLVCKLLDYRGQHMLPIAAVSEYVHTASLLHDDVIDNTTLRRRKPTVNSRWGDESSILVGDLIYAHASKLMTETGNLQIVASFAQAIRRMSEGELIQLENLYQIDISEEMWLRIIHYKTAELLGAACKSAGLLAQVESRLYVALYEFGINVGIAFQLIDDTLDFCGREKDLGKQTMIDIMNGKITLPLILLYRQGDTTVRTTLETITAKPRPSASDLLHIYELVTHYGTVEQTADKAATYTAKAVQALDVFATSTAKSELIKLTDLLLSRVN